MTFPFVNTDGAPDDVVDIFQNQLIIEMSRPYINGRRIDEATWVQIKKIFSERCVPCFPIHYPALYIKLHQHKLTTRAINTFTRVVEIIRDKGCDCQCHTK